MRSTSIEYKDNSKRVYGSELEFFEIFKTDNEETFMFIGDCQNIDDNESYNSRSIEDSGIIYLVREDEEVNLLKAKIIIEK